MVAIGKRGNDDIDEDYVKGEIENPRTNYSNNRGQERENNDMNQVIGQVANAAVLHGIKGIISRHPRFRGKEDYLIDFLDRDKLNLYVQKRVQYRLDRGESIDEKAVKDIYEHIASGVASGKLFNESGQEIVLRKSLEEKARSFTFGRRNARETLRGEEYLETALDSFKDIYELLKTGDYARRMPEFTQAVVNIYDSGFFDSSLNILYEKGMMNDRKYTALKRALTKKVENSAKAAVNQLEKYITAGEALAASIITLLGIWVIFASNSFTGHVIGITTDSTKNIPVLIFGVSLLISGGLIFSHKKISRMRKKL